MRRHFRQHRRIQTIRFAGESKPGFIVNLSPDSANRIRPQVGSKRVRSRYQWTKDDRPLVVNGLGVQQVVGRGTLILTDDEPTGQHNGVYQCFASNQFGTAVGHRIHLRRASWSPFFMVALWNRADHIYFHAVVCSLFFFFSSPNLNRRRLDVCHTSTHGVALVRI